MPSFLYSLYYNHEADALELIDFLRVRGTVLICDIMGRIIHHLQYRQFIILDRSKSVCNNCYDSRGSFCLTCLFLLFALQRYFYRTQVSTQHISPPLTGLPPPIPYHMNVIRMSEGSTIGGADLHRSPVLTSE